MSKVTIPRVRGDYKPILAVTVAGMSGVTSVFVDNFFLGVFVIFVAYVTGLYLIRSFVRECIAADRERIRKNFDNLRRRP